MTEPLDAAPEDLRRGPPELMAAMPSWYPGAWAPPAETLTVASVLVALAGASWLFRNDVVKTLFRFSFDAIWLAVPGALLALAITLIAAPRPGSWWPRIWALALTAFCTAVAVWGVVDRIKSERASPQVHALSFIGLMAALALAPRLLRIYPYSAWVQHIAAVSLVWSLALCLWGAIVAEKKVIREESARIEKSIQDLNALASDVRKTTTFGWSKRGDQSGAARQIEALKKITLTGSLPDSYVWLGAGLLDKQEALQHAVSTVLDAVGEAVLNPQGPKHSLARVRAEDRNASRWRMDSGFSRSGKLVADYYREVTRLQRELDANLPSSPAKDQYDAQRREYDRRLQSFSSNLGEKWIADLAANDKEVAPWQKLLEGRFEGQPYRLGDVWQWKSLSWSDARSLLGHPGCATEPVTYSVPEIERVADPNETSGYREVTVTYNYRRVECYVYRTPATQDGAEIAAELHLMYKLGSSRGYNAPFSVSFYFEPPPGVEASQFQGELMRALAEIAQERLGKEPERFQNDATISFKMPEPREFTVRASRLVRPENAPTVNVTVK